MEVSPTGRLRGERKDCSCRKLSNQVKDVPKPRPLVLTTLETATWYRPRHVPQEDTHTVSGTVASIYLVTGRPQLRLAPLPLSWTGQDPSSARLHRRSHEPRACRCMAAWPASSSHAPLTDSHAACSRMTLLRRMTNSVIIGRVSWRKGRFLGAATSSASRRISLGFPSNRWQSGLAHRLLAEQALQLAHLTLHRPVL